MGAPGPSLSKEQLDSIQEMLNSVIRNPRDVELLMKMGQKARELAAVVNESAQLHRILDKMAQELGLALSNPEMP
jgi:ribosomal protein L32E